MTTIVADSRSGTMAADSHTTNGTVKWSSRKIERIGGSLIGCAGECSDIEAFLDWVRKGKLGRRPKCKEMNALELDAGGLWLWDETGKRFPPGREYHAIGSGAMAALAAFELGADAVRAVEVACAVDDGSGLPVQVEKF